jgi:hypothetical protein
LQEAIEQEPLFKEQATQFVQHKIAQVQTVPDNKSRNIPEVVLVRRWAVGVLRIWRGEGQLGEGWGKWGQLTSNLRPRWTIPVTARRVPSKCKGETKGSQQGERKSQGNCAMYICNCACMCNGMIGRVNDASYRIYNNNNRNECR